MKKKVTSASGFFRLRFLIVLFVSLTGFVLLALGELVTAHSFSDLAFQGSNRFTQKRSSSPIIEWDQVVSGLTQPTTVTNAGDGSGRIFIVQETGEILILMNGSVLPPHSWIFPTW